MSDPSFARTATKRLFRGFISFAFYTLFFHTAVFVWDLGLAIINLASIDRAVGDWPEPGRGQGRGYQPPEQRDSRCSCPALNAMANHGIIPRSGENIGGMDLANQTARTFNLAPSVCSFLLKYACNTLNRGDGLEPDYSFDLADLDVHNGIEHDASLLRVNAAEDTDQSKIATALVERVLKAGTGPNGDLTAADLSRLLGQRRLEAKKGNATYSQTFMHRFFGTLFASTLLTIFGGKLEDIRTFLTEERLPDNWEPRIRYQHGLTMVESFLSAGLEIELGIKEEIDGTLEQARPDRGSREVRP